MDNAFSLNLAGCCPTERTGPIIFTRGDLCGSHPERRNAERSSRAGPGQVRAGHQPEDGEGARSHCSANTPRPRRRGHRMKRRAFIAGLGCTVTWPLVASAREMPHVAVLLNFTEKSGQPLLAVFLQEFRRLGWVDGETAHIDVRWGAGDAARIRKGVAELLALAPDVIVTSSTPPTSMFLDATRTIPIVFGSIVDPVGSGFVESLSQPGGNVTGFTNYEYSIGQKWLELLKEIAPAVRRVGILRDPTNVAEIGMLGAIQTAGPQLGVEFRPVDTRTIVEIEHSIAVVARGGYGGLIITSGSGAAVSHRDRIIELAATLKLPAVYSDRGYIPEGGLIS